MFQKIKIVFIISLLIIGSFGLNAQTDSIVSTISPDTTIISNKVKGEIVITKSDLIKFLDKIAKARKDKIEFELENIYLNDLYGQFPLGANNISTRAVVPLTSSTPIQSMSRDQLIREIGMLNSRLNQISEYAGVGNTTAIITGSDYVEEGVYYHPYQAEDEIVDEVPLLAYMGNGELRWKIDSLQQEVSMLSAPAIVAENQEEIGRLNREIDKYQDAILATTVLTPEAREIVRSYGTSQMQVFFANDVSNVSPRYFEEVKSAATVLRRNPQLAVVLKGYASPVGSERYNYDLSMRRNEAVKRMLIDYGMFPDQITSVFYGADKTSSASEARRVDIKFIIK